MKKSITYVIACIASMLLFKISMGQCVPSTAYPTGFTIADGGGTGSSCPTQLNFDDYCSAGIYVNDVECCLYYKGNNVIYWPLGVAFKWSADSKEKGHYHLCSVTDYFQSDGTNYKYFNRSYNEAFVPTHTGIYQMGCRIDVKQSTHTIKNIGTFWKPKWVWYEVKCSGIAPSHYNDKIQINVCVIDIPKPTITKGDKCGVNILYAPSNTTEFSYYFQTAETGESTNNPGPQFNYTLPGKYYLRARHNATGTWGPAENITVFPQPLLAPPPIPTVTGGFCGNTMLTEPSPPAGVTYFWEGTSCGVDQSNNASSPYIVSQSGKPHYVRAYSVWGCWSDCSVVTPYINDLPPPVVQNVYACSCAPGPITLTATYTSPASNLKWYDDANALIATAHSITVNPTSNKTYYVSAYNSASGCESTKVPVKIVFKSCGKCLDDFAPIPGQKYVISAWVKESNNFEKTTYTHADVTLLFNGSTDPAKTFKASGEIIEGWQKIEKDFIVPTGTTGIKIQLNNSGSSDDVFFDDIRIFPFKSNMVSYVYDPKTLKLVAELDANNYATYYVYDDEGKLSKVKKETVNGVKTITEGRAGTVIK
jgi:hypothetical protein